MTVIVGVTDGLDVGSLVDGESVGLNEGELDVGELGVGDSVGLDVDGERVGLSVSPE